MLHMLGTLLLPLIGSLWYSSTVCVITAYSITLFAAARLNECECKQVKVKMTKVNNFALFYRTIAHL